MKKGLPDGGYLQQTSFIPEPFCFKGKTLKLKNKGSWEDGWKVMETGQPIHEKLVEFYGMGYRKHKEISDV